MIFICAFYISKFSTKRKHDYNSGGKTLKILKYKTKFKNVNLVSAGWMNGWAGPLRAWRTVSIPGEPWTEKAISKETDGRREGPQLQELRLINDATASLLRPHWSPDRDNGTEEEEV